MDLRSSHLLDNAVQEPAPAPRSAGPARPSAAAARRVVVKLGTRVVVDDDGTLAQARLASLVSTIAALRRTKREVTLVSSGAVGVGRALLGVERLTKDPALRQACAAAGQTRLMELFQRCFGGLDLLCGQVLVNQGDFDDRVRALRLRGTLSALLERGVVPIVNENDAVACEPLRAVAGVDHPVFADNDRLAALIAGVLNADLLVLLTDVDGLFDQDPRVTPSARVLTEVERPEQLPAIDRRPGSSIGRGGMASKVEAAWIARTGGCQTVIANGRASGALSHVLAGEAVGTWFPSDRFLPARHRWIAFAAVSRGTLHLDAGAIAALRDHGASLLAAGVIKVEGDFAAGDVVELRGVDGTRVGRARSSLDAPTTRCRCQLRRAVGRRNRALIRRDQIVLEQESDSLGET